MEGKTRLIAYHGPRSSSLPVDVGRSGDTESQILLGQAWPHSQKEKKSDVNWLFPTWPLILTTKNRLNRVFSSIAPQTPLSRARKRAKNAPRARTYKNRYATASGNDSLLMTPTPETHLPTIGRSGGPPCWAVVALTGHPRSFAYGFSPRTQIAPAGII